MRVVAAALDQTFSFNVINVGRGLSAEQIRKIGPHVQFEREKYEQQGAGLGLIIAKRLTELRLNPTTQARIDELAGQANEWLLTPAERAEYADIVEGLDFLGILKAKARSAMARSGR